MGSVFASNRGRIILRSLIAGILLSLGIFLFSGGGGGSSSSPTTMASSNSDPISINGNQVYASPTASDDGSADNSTPSPTSTQNDQSEILGSAKSTATNFVTQWISYDYHKPLTSSNLPGFPKDGGLNKTLVNELNAYNKQMVASKSLVNGSISNAAITKMTYNGDAEQGAGQGMVDVSTTLTVTNNQTGQAGSQEQFIYHVAVSRVNPQSPSPDASTWIVTDIKGVKQ